MNAEFYWNNVKSLCKSRRITQEALANKCELNFRTLQNWIGRKILPDVVSAYKIARALDTTVEALVSEESNDVYKERYDKLAAKLKRICESL